MKKVILADDHPIFLTGMAKMIALEDDMRIVAQCVDKERLMRAISTLRSTVAIVASSLQPDMPTLVRLAHAVGCKLVVLEPVMNLG